MKINKICVIGLGYIGLPTSAILANNGYNVTGVDLLESVVDTVNAGNIHIIEPGLEDVVKKAVKNKFLCASLKPEDADVFIIAVPTPFKENHVPNIEYVLTATKTIAPFIKKGNIIILESTSPVGTTEKVFAELQKYGHSMSDIYIAYCPERVLPGKVMFELIENDRIVGGLNEISSQIVKDFYKTFVNGDVLITDARTAEMCKLVENSYRDVNIAFANELSIICNNINVDVWELIRLANRHPRVNVLSPGAGVGGHCIAVDPWFIVSQSPDDANIIKQARLTNDYKSYWVIQKIEKSINEFIAKHQRSPTVACMGLSFKPNIDDLRESPAVNIVNSLLSKSSDIQFLLVEPHLRDSKDFDLTEYSLAIDKADIVVYLVKHDIFINYKNVSSKVLLDFCGVNQ
jgi:UDP-N-acetyl-D-mannosaminuronic acid dehydrogenase